MQRWLLAVLLALGAIAPLGAQEPDPATAPRIPMQEFKSLLASNKVLVIDVRDEMSFATGHIPGARSIPLSHLLDPATVKELKGTKQAIVLYCA